MDNTKSLNQENQKNIYDLIQSIQAKINTQDNTEQSELKENNNTNTNPDTNLNIDNPQSMLNNIDLSSILSSLNLNGNNQSKEENNSFNFGDIDPNTIFKIQRLISNFTKNDPKKDLLRSLKPFLRKSRQDKFGEYMTILSLIDAIDIFGSKGSD